MAIKLNKSKLKNLEKFLTKLLKDEIIKQKLIVTGKMLKETKAVIKTDKDGFTVEVHSTKYFKFVDGDNDIVDNAFKGKNFNKLLKQIEVLYKDFFEKILDEQIKEME